MMKSRAARYTLLGFSGGLLVPILTTVEAVARRGVPLSLDSLLSVYADPAGGLARWLAVLAPFGIGWLTYRLGLERDRRVEDTRRLRLLADVRSALSTATGLDTLLSGVAPKWAELIGAAECTFAAWDAEHDEPIPLVVRTPFNAVLAGRRVMPENVPLARWVIEHNAVKALPPDGETGVLGVPLTVSLQVVGVALFDGVRVAGQVSEYEGEVVRAVAEQLALTINHLRASADLRRRARDMEAIGQVARRIAAGWGIERILTTVVESTQVRFGLDYLAILTVDEAAGEFVERAQAGPLVQPAGAPYRQKLSAGLAGRVYASGQRVLTRDVREEPAYIDVVGSEVRSELIQPLRSGARVVGIMVFGSRHVDAFGDEDVEALQMLADQVAVAVENARLYDDALRGRQRLSAVLASTGDAVMLTDATDHIRLFNRTAERLFDVAARQVIGLTLEEALRVPALIEEYRNAPESHVFELALNESTTLLGNLTPVRDETLGLIGRVLTLHDISDLKRLDALKSQMIRMASHDLRNPLNMAFGYLDLLSDAVSDRMDKVGPFVEGLETGLRRMHTLIEDLLNVERIESATERNREPVDVNRLARLAADELRQQAEAKQHQLTIHLADAPAWVSADPVQLRQVAVNLVSNAIKYTPNGGRIHVRVTCADDKATLEVEDNGLGIPKQAQARLFQRFYRVKMKGTEDIEGTGLGLNLVKTIVEQHRGTIEVDSDEGRGSIFRVRLPLLADAAPEDG